MKSSQKKKRVLVVDDEVQICNIVQKVLSREGYHIVTALSGDEALKQLEKTAVDLILVDLKMPGMDGLEMLRQARDIQGSLRAVLMTAYGTASSARNAMALGVCDFVAKPFDNRLLKKVVKEVLGADR
ncbi:MAG: response regulator [Candidatus Eisenbacteria bacterium]|nr:response regulator [Candidatus Eisenbacteria bacterium]